MWAVMIVDHLISLRLGVNVWANGDEARYNQRAAQTDMPLFRKLDRAGNGLLTEEDTRGDLHLGRVSTTSMPTAMALLRCK